MPPLVSVILPTYNRVGFLAEAIESVLGQSHGELEALVIDDGSTDGTREFVRETYADDERVRYQRQANAGVAAARNTGIKHSRGDLLAFIDSDDIWEPWKLELQLRCLELAPEAGMLWTDMQAIGPQGEGIAPAFLTQYYRAYRYFTRQGLFSRSIPLREAGKALPVEAADRNLYVGDIFSEMIMGNLVHTPTVILRRNRLEKVGLFNESFRWGEDFDFWLRTCREGPVAYADVSSIRYRIDMSDNISNSGNSARFAASYLATIEPVLERDRNRIALPPRMTTQARAYGHLWLARALLVSGGSPTGARAHLKRALRLRPWQPEALIVAPLAYAPPLIRVPLIRAMRVGKRLHNQLRAPY